MSYAIEVVGRTWEGFKSAYVYHAHNVPSEGCALAEYIKRIAGDFAQVEDFRIIRQTMQASTIGNKHTRVITEETLVNFREPESEDIFLDCMGEA